MHLIHDCRIGDLWNLSGYQVMKFLAVYVYAGWQFTVPNPTWRPSAALHVMTQNNSLSTDCCHSNMMLGSSSEDHETFARYLLHVLLLSIASAERQQIPQLLP